MKSLNVMYRIQYDLWVAPLAGMRYHLEEYISSFMYALPQSSVGKRCEECSSTSEHGREKLSAPEILRMS
jgi:hypothetical protein